MTYDNDPQSEVPIGLWPEPELIRVVNRTGGHRSEGSIIMWDILAWRAKGATYGPGEQPPPIVDVVLPAMAQLKYGLFGVVTSGGNDGEWMVACVQGKVRAKVSGSMAAARGTPLVAVDGEDFLNSDELAPGRKIVARALDLDQAMAGG